MRCFIAALLTIAALSAHTALADITGPAPETIVSMYQRPVMH